jgi:hypothetical protein
MTIGWGEEETGAGMANPPESIPDPQPSASVEPGTVTELIQPQVRLSESEPSDSFVIPGGITIGHQWQQVTAELLAVIQQSATLSRIQLDVKED